jgi:DNA-binding MarR family transcriptional regulator
VHVSTATHTIDRLAAKGFVERKRAKQDRRIVQVTFSRKGKSIHRYVAASRVAAAREMLKVLSPGARRIFLQRMTKIATAR